MTPPTPGATPTPAPTLNGQVIGQAERHTRALLDTLLARTGTTFEGWVSINLLGTQGEQTLDALVEQMVTGLRISRDAARAAIEGGRDAGAIDIAATCSLTDLGRARYAEITAGIADITATLYSDIPRDDLVVARRVLETLTERARRALAA